MKPLPADVWTPARIEFDARPIMADDVLTEHIKRNLKRDIGAKVDTSPLVLRVIANGPSAIHAPLDGITLALNGALGMMLKRGVSPTFWAACDPQELVTEFLDVIPEETTYLVASKCHPKVFERLAHRDVCMWHLDDVPGVRGVMHTSTITLTALNLMRALGWRKFEVWGWDACYLDGRHHANETHNASPDEITCTIGERSFRTTQAWACEAEEAGAILPLMDYRVRIKGNGMIAAYMEAL